MGHYSDKCPENNENNSRNQDGGGNEQHMQEGEETVEEEIIEEGVQEHMSGTEIKGHVIEEDEEEYDSDDGSVYLNFQFNRMKIQ